MVMLNSPKFDFLRVVRVFLVHMVPDHDVKPPNILLKYLSVSLTMNFGISSRRERCQPNGRLSQRKAAREVKCVKYTSQQDAENVLESVKPREKM